jgi:hypothetical protein
VLPRRERRRQAADDLYSALVGQHYTFWEHIHCMFLRRDMTRHDLRQLLSRGLSTTRGNYRALLKLFGMPESDYKRFMNFLAAHECVVDFRPFRVDALGALRLPTSADRALRFDESRSAGPRGAGTRRAGPAA